MPINVSDDDDVTNWLKKRPTTIQGSVVGGGGRRK